MKKLSEHNSIEDWLELEQNSNPLDNKGKRRVRHFQLKEKSRQIVSYSDLHAIDKNSLIFRSPMLLIKSPGLGSSVSQPMK